MTVREAKGLADKDTFNKSDPYCILECNPTLESVLGVEGVSKRTKTIQNDLNPVWNERLEPLTLVPTLPQSLTLTLILTLPQSLTLTLILTLTHVI